MKGRERNAFQVDSWSVFEPRDGGMVEGQVMCVVDGIII